MLVSTVGEDAHCIRAVVPGFTNLCWEMAHSLRGHRLLYLFGFLVGVGLTAL